MNYILKEVDFNSYCKKCINKNNKESDDICNECLNQPMRYCSQKPLNYKEDKNENSRNSNK